MIRKHHQYAAVIILLIAAAGLVSAYTTSRPGQDQVQPKAEGEGASELGAALKYRIEPRVDELLRDVSDYIAAAESFSFHAEITYDDVLFSGQKIEYGGTLEVAVRRPDRSQRRWSTSCCPCSSP